jgi:flagellar protein FliO/FliZ
MDIITSEQALTALLFLALLGAVAFVLRLRQRGGGGVPGRRMRVAETLALSPGDQALILEVDGRDYLLVRQRGAAPAILGLPEVQA